MECRQLAAQPLFGKLHGVRGAPSPRLVCKSGSSPSPHTLAATLLLPSLSGQPRSEQGRGLPLGRCGGSCQNPCTCTHRASKVPLTSCPSQDGIPLLQAAGTERHTREFGPGFIYASPPPKMTFQSKQLSHLLAGRVVSASGIPRQKCESIWSKDC